MSLSIVSVIVYDHGGAWLPVLEAPERRWMEPDFALPDGGLGFPSSVRATLEESLTLLPDASRVAFAGLGILPTRMNVGAHVLARLWRLQMDSGDVTGAHLPSRVGSSSGEVAELSGVDLQVSQLVRAGPLTRREVNV